MTLAYAGQDESARSSKALLAIAVFVGYFVINGITNRALFTVSPWLVWIADTIFYSLVPLALLMHLHRTARIRPADYGLAPVRQWGTVAAMSVQFAIVFGAAYLGVVHLAWALLHAGGLGHLTTASFSYQSAMPSGWGRGVVAAYLAGSAGVFESIFFIGLPMLLWRQRFGKAHDGAFVLLSACAFATGHWEQGAAGVAGALAFGLLACALYRKTSDLWPIVIAHVLVDLLVL